MKRMYIGVALLAILLAVGICLTAVFVWLHRPITEALEQAQAAALAGEWAQVETLTETVYRRWQTISRFTAAVADHEPLEEMDALLARLSVLEATRQQEEFAATCAELARRSDAMADSQRLTWWNLL